MFATTLNSTSSSLANAVLGPDDKSKNMRNSLFEIQPSLAIISTQKEEKRNEMPDTPAKKISTA